ncbi:MAG: hypothetical protein J1F39_00585 [Clostridiales bacterium]|nr:hypothetical protein [Clostridiales bacterium]
MGKIAELFGRLRNVKHIKVIAFAAVLVLVLGVYFLCASCADETTPEVKEPTYSDYCSNMQAQIEKIVSEISGVGSASVVISWDKSVTASSFGGGVTENPQATGAIIVCDGGGSTKVKLDVMYAVSTLLNLSIEKIMVYPK